jgi:hypothetical protein
VKRKKGRINGSAPVNSEAVSLTPMQAKDLLIAMARKELVVMQAQRAVEAAEQAVAKAMTAAGLDATRTYAIDEAKLTATADPTHGN